MRYLFCCLMLLGCTGDDVVPSSPDMCKNITEVQQVSVPYSFDVGTEIETYVMDNGCTYTITTNYVYDSNTGGPGAGGSAPDPRHCDIDGCGGPNDKRNDFTDPAMMNIDNMGMMR